MPHISQLSDTDLSASSPSRLPRLSKSKIQAGHQCALRLWNDCFERDLAEPPDARTQFQLDRGSRVGDLARRRYPGGRLIEAGPRERRAALRETRRALGEPSLPSIYEAAVEHRGVLARIDVLRRVPTRAGDRFDLIEVKSATRVKDVYVRDLAIQLWIARGAGLPVRRAGLLLLDPAYVYDGRHLDLEALFRFEDLSTEVDAMHGDVERLVGSLKRMLGAGSPPRIAPGDHCTAPYTCPYLAHCASGADGREHPVADLPRLHVAKREALHEQGIEEIRDIPGTFPLDALQARVRECIRLEREYVGPELAAQLASAVEPVYHLDFETFMPAIPLYAGTRPYETIPFQYSVHVEEPHGLRHSEYLHERRDAPHRPLAERLLADLGTSGSICTYTRYEERMIRLLALHVPALAAPLLALVDRLWDLHPVVRDHYYHPELRGSFSMKSVAPVLAPRLSYTALEIGDGMAAANAFETGLDVPDGADRNRLLDDLRAYCATDTLAMLEVRRALQKRATGG